MKTVLSSVCFLLFFFSCVNSDTTEIHNSKEIIIRSGVESVLDGVEVSCANISKTKYSVGAEVKEGLSANLILPNNDSWLRVGAESSFDLNNKTWVVIKVNKNSISVKQQID